MNSHQLINKENGNIGSNDLTEEIQLELNVKKILILNKKQVEQERQAKEAAELEIRLAAERAEREAAEEAKRLADIEAEKVRRANEEAARLQLEKELFEQQQQQQELEKQREKEALEKAEAIANSVESPSKKLIESIKVEACDDNTTTTTTAVDKEVTVEEKTNENDIEMKVNICFVTKIHTHNRKLKKYFFKEPQKSISLKNIQNCLKTRLFFLYKY